MKVERILAGAIMACLFATASSYGQRPEVKTTGLQRGFFSLIQLWVRERLRTCRRSLTCLLLPFISW